MINLYISPESQTRMYAEINNKIDGIKELKSSDTKRQILSAAFSISSLKFVRTTNMLARSAKSNFHHVYEWGQVGNESGRLFRIIKKQNSSSSMSIYYKFNNSKKMAPIASELKVPGKTGRVVSKSGIFKNKASVMENGSPVSFVTQRTIAIPSNGQVAFIPAGKNITIRNPGGSSTSGSFETHFRTWWQTNFAKNFDNSGIPKQLESRLASTLSMNNAGRSQARNTISSVLSSATKVGSII